MPRVIDDRVVEMEFDNANFEKNVGQSLSTLDKLKAALSFKGADHDFGIVENAAEGLGKSFSMMEQIATGALRNFGTKLENWAENTIKTMSGVKQIMEGFNKYTTLTESSFTLQGQGFKSKEVSKQLRRLTWFTDETSYNLSDMVDNMAKFTSKGLGLKESADDMMGIALWAASAGQNAQTASRAMYQLSQAMAGPMNLMDWRSIENANMNTAEFQKIALETAASMGLVEKNAKGMYRSLAPGSEYKDWFSSDRGFRNSLAGKWFTPEVQSAVYRKYTTAVDDIYKYIQKHPGTLVADAIEALGSQLDEFGVHALLMAQQSKTWADTVNATADAVSTKWSGVFTHIFGNASQSTKFFSALTEEFYTMFADPMNSLLDVFLEWRQAFGRKEWQSSFISMLQSVNTVLGSIGGTINKFAFGDRANKLIKYSKKVKKAYEIAGISKRTGKAGTVIGPDRLLVENASDDYEVMTKARASALMDLTHKFTEFSKKVQKAAEDTSFFERITLGVLSAFGLVKLAVSGLLTALKPFEPLVKGILRWAVDRVLALADAVSTLYASAKKNNTFTKLFTSILRPFVTLYTKLREFIEKFVPRFQKRWESFTGHFGKLGDRAEGVKKKFGEFFDLIKSKWEKLFSNWDVDKTIDGIFNGLSKVKQFVYDLIGVKDDEGFAEWVDNTLTSASQSFETFKENVTRTFGSVWEDLKQCWKEALAWIEEHWSGISSTFSDIFEGIKGFGIAFWMAIKGFFSKDTEGDGTSGLEGVIQTFKDFGTILGTVLGAIWKALKPLVDGIKNTLESMSLEGAGDVLEGGGIAALGIAFYKWTQNFGKGSWMKGFKNVLDGVGEALGGFTKLLDAKALKEAAIGIAILVASLFILISLPEDDLARAASAMATIIFILSTSLKKLSGFTTGASINSKGLNFSKSGAGSTLLMAALSFVAIAAVLKIIAAIPEDDLYRAVTVVSILMGIMTFMLKAIMKLQNGGNTDDHSTNIGRKNNYKNKIGSGNSLVKVGGPAATIFAFAIFLGAVVLALKKVSDLSKDKAAFTTAIITVGAIVLALGVFLVVVGSFYKQTGENGNITAPSATLWKNILALSAAIYIIAMAFKKIATIDRDAAGSGRLLGTGAFILAVMGILIRFAAVARNGDFSNAGKLTRALLGFAVAIGIIALVTAELAKIKPAQGRWIGVVGVLAVIGGIIVALALAGKLYTKNDKEIKNFQKFALSLAVIAGAIAIASVGLYALSKIDSDKLLTALAAMAIVMGSFAAAGVIGKFLGDGLIKFSTALLGIAGAVALMAVAFLAAAEAIRIFSDDSLDIHQAAENIKTFMDEIVENVGQWATTLLSAFLETALAGIPATVEALVDTIAVTLADLTEKDATGKMKIATLIDNALSIVIAVFGGIADRADEIVFSVGDALVAILYNLGIWVQNNKGKISESLAAVVQGIIDVIVDLFDKLGETIFGQEDWDEIRSILEEAMSWLGITFVPGVSAMLELAFAPIYAAIEAYKLFKSLFSEEPSEATPTIYDRYAATHGGHRGGGGKIPLAPGQVVGSGTKDDPWKVGGGALKLQKLNGDSATSKTKTSSWSKKLVSDVNALVDSVGNGKSRASYTVINNTATVNNPIKESSTEQFRKARVLLARLQGT